MTLRQVSQDWCPPVVWRALKSAYRSVRPVLRAVRSEQNVVSQDLDPYWDPRMAEVLEHWGEGTVWSEIQLLLATARGRVLDIACGTGKTIQLSSAVPGIEVHGCDISDFLIRKAAERGIPAERLKVCDATATDYPAGYFDYAYSIGSLEHFTPEGIGKLMAECRRIVNVASFHMVPVSRANRDEGWITTTQSYHNNSVDWWLQQLRPVIPGVFALSSRWQDDISVGAWFVCPAPHRSKADG